MCGIQEQFPLAPVSSIRQLYAIEVLPVHRCHYNNFIYGLMHHLFAVTRNLYVGKHLFIQLGAWCSNLSVLSHDV